MSGLPSFGRCTNAADAQERVHLIGSNGMSPAPAGANGHHISRSDPAAAAADGCTAATVMPALPVRIPALCSGSEDRAAHRCCLYDCT